MSILALPIRWFYLIVVRIFFALFTRLKIEGLENIPHKNEGPLVIVSNHFSMFEVPLLARILPKVPTYFGAKELLEDPVVRYGAIGFKNEIIFVRRGKVDREALKAAQRMLQEKGWLSIFPEGGITELTVAMSGRGESTAHLVGHNSRVEGNLLPALPGAAFLAAQTHAHVLPIAIIGTEKLEGNLNLRKKIDVVVRIGPVYGPLMVPDHLRGRERREAINRYGHGMMEAVARLMPPGNRGHYQYVDQPVSEA
ncbi:MAG: lysophospholipid acyltransferase family protein [Ardenticatenaceae bacterium]|nr:lysophospholipid acyltransferase family protein [Ardenticatenaceae bacterium]